MDYEERLFVPLRWWVQGTMLIATLWLALVVAVPLAFAWAVTAALLLVMAALYLSYGSARLRVADGWFEAGRARIEVAHLGPAEPLEHEETRLAAGRDADARAFLVLRPYLKRAVRVPILDPADPTPYWLVSTRRGAALAAALEAARAEGAPLAEH